MDHVERPAAQQERTPSDSLSRDFIEEGGESRKAYLKESWLAAAIATLARARWDAGLTQTELAERLNTKQPSIARLENANDATLSRFWEFLYECGVTPAEIELVPVKDLTQFIVASPDAPRTASAIAQWQRTDHIRVDFATLAESAARALSGAQDVGKALSAAVNAVYATDLFKAFNLGFQSTPIPDFRNLAEHARGPAATSTRVESGVGALLNSLAPYAVRKDEKEMLALSSGANEPPTSRRPKLNAA